MSMTKLGVWAATVLILVPLAGAQSYTITDLGTLPGGTITIGAAINDLGSIVGEATVSGDNKFHSFLWTAAGGMQDLGTLSGDSTSAALAINNSGEVAGSSTSTLDGSRAFTWTANTGMRQLGVRGTEANAINDAGEAAGFYTLANDVDYHAAVWTKSGSMVDLGTLGGLKSSARAINKSGVAAGYSYLSDGTDVHAFRWSSTDGMQDLGTLGGDNSTALGVSASGEVLGASTAGPNQLDQGCLWTQDGAIESLGLGAGSEVWAANSSGQLVGAYGGDYNRAFLWTPGHRAQDLNSLIPPKSGWVLNVAYDINKSGQIVAAGIINGQTHSALLTPMN